MQVNGPKIPGNQPPKAVVGRLSARDKRRAKEPASTCWMAQKAFVAT